MVSRQIVLESVFEKMQILIKIVSRFKITITNYSKVLCTKVAKTMYCKEFSEQCIKTCIHISTYNAQCSKIGKKCNFKGTKTHFLLFQKWQKINFCSGKKFKIAFLVLNFFLVQKLIFCHF